MKTTKNQFKRFKKEFKRYQKMLGLTDYRVCFHLETMDDRYAHIRYDTLARTAGVSLDTGGDFLSIKRHAKHECLHLLLADLNISAQQRSSTKERIDQADESIVRRLERLYFKDQH
jgi:hypothetical protein